MKRARRSLQYVEPGWERDLVGLYIDWMLTCQDFRHVAGAAHRIDEQVRRLIRHMPFPVKLGVVDCLLLFVFLFALPPGQHIPHYAVPFLWAGVYAVSFTATCVLPYGRERAHRAHWI